MNTNKTQAEQLPQDAVMQSVLKNQVRIGNFVYFNGQTETVYAIRNSGVDFYRGKTKKSVIMQSYVWEAIKPIPLTKDWLSKLSFFIVETNGIFEANLPNFRYSIQTAKDYDGFFFCDGENVLTNFNYVHELQNLVFALTQRELTVA